MARLPLPLKFGLPLSILMVTASLFIQLALEPFVGVILFLTMYPVIFLSTWLGGSRPGFTALFLSILVVDYYFVNPIGSFGIHETKDFIRLSFYIFNNILIIFALHRLRRAEKRSQELLGDVLESELRYRTIVELSPNIIWFSDTEGNTTYLNRTWYEYTGLSHEESMLLGWSKVIHPLDRDHLMSSWLNAVKKGVSHEIEFRAKRKDGEYRWFLARAKPMLGHDGNIERWIGKAEDFHEQKMGLITRDIFFSFASHELKTPLTSLRLKMQVMERKIQDGEEELKNPKAIQNFIQSSIESVDVFQSIVDEMLDVSRISAGKMNYCMKKVETGLVLKSAIDTVSSQFKEAGIPLHIEMAESASFMMDPQKINQVVINLLTNALKYGGQKPVWIKTQKDAQTFFIHVKDQGDGIPDEDQRRIFHCFERLDNTQSTGLGVGLFISHQIIEAHGGTISLQSQIGEGSTFTVSLPIKEE